MKQEVLGRTNRLLSLIRHGPHWKLRVQQFFYCCVCIRYRGNVSTEPLPSNYRGIFTEPLPSNDRGFLPSHCLATIRGLSPSNCLATIGRIHTHTHIRTATWSHKPTIFFPNNDSRLKIILNWRGVVQIYGLLSGSSRWVSVAGFCEHDYEPSMLKNEIIFWSRK
jgi:hypothetical protein